MIVIGVDPGSKGAIVILVLEGVKTLSVGSSKEVSGANLYDLIAQEKADHVFIEKAQSMPRQGISSAFTYGTGYGGLLAAVEIAKVPFTLISPRIWTSKMHLGCEGDNPKEKSVKAFARIFPGMGDGIKNRNGKLHDGIVDAALIAMYGARYVVSYKTDVL